MYPDAGAAAIDLDRGRGRRQLRSQLSSQERCIRARQTNRPATIEQRTHQSLPPFDFLYFIEENARVFWRELLDQRQQCRKASRSKIVQARIFEVAIKQALVPAHQLAL